eukprot:TRINITY_DN1161_c1_g2_i15.p2 TRINITY_DN1161_c1_g2~~TRINITY_DN1161_c1_g2_i15.p2  ORF type:complete len:120 (-),score=24.19 TRINITY_DN1161_c1_g2_i15:312-671(-)
MKPTIKATLHALCHLRMYKYLHLQDSQLKPKSKFPILPYVYGIKVLTNDKKERRTIMYHLKNWYEENFCNTRIIIGGDFNMKFTNEDIGTTKTRVDKKKLLLRLGNKEKPFLKGKPDQQ